eukprot:6686373-Prymnesium_polylepis.1
MPCSRIASINSSGSKGKSCAIVDPTHMKRSRMPFHLRPALRAAFSALAASIPATCANVILVVAASGVNACASRLMCLLDWRFARCAGWCDSPSTDASETSISVQKRIEITLDVPACTVEPRSCDSLTASDSSSFGSSGHAKMRRLVSSRGLSRAGRKPRSCTSWKGLVSLRL